MKFNPVLFAKAISDETRQKIMNLCCCDSLSVNEIVEKLDVSQPTVSHHLAIFWSLSVKKASKLFTRLIRKTSPSVADS
jgi:DNA-binding transcriptional ArsR family regulator